MFTQKMKKLAAGFLLGGFLMTGALAGVGYAQARASLTNGAVVTIRSIISGALTFATGTVLRIPTTADCSAPSLAISGDLNTGLTSTGADTLAFCTAGVANGTLDASGNFGVSGNFNGNANVRAGSTGSIYFNGRSVMESPVNGAHSFANLAGTDYSYLRFGPASTSGWRFKFSGNEISAREGDDSDFVDFKANAFTYNSTITPVTGTVAIGATIVAATTFRGAGVTFATLPGSPSNGDSVYCSDCTIANPTASGGTGAIVKRLNGVWVGN